MLLPTSDVRWRFVFDSRQLHLEFNFLAFSSVRVNFSFLGFSPFYSVKVPFPDA
jgi:hypothetical protein